jgi:ATP-dependent helicase/nuclease subunit B
VVLNGKIDRVDVFRHGDKTYLRAVDYKTGKKVFSINDIDKKKNLQLLLYIYALTDASYGGNSVPAVISYLSASSERTEVSGSTSADAVKANVFREFKRSGLILDDPDVLAAVSRSENKRYLMATGRAQKPTTLTEDAFNYLNEKIKNILKEVAEDMRGGKAQARPAEKGDCKYCEYNMICRAAKKSKNQSY